MIGVVRMVNNEKRFGFIKSGDADYFFHATEFNGHWDDLEVDFRMGKRIQVEFLEDKGPKGLRANQVSRTDWPNSTAREYDG